MNRISDLTRRLWAALLALCLVLALTLPVFAEGESETADTAEKETFHIGTVDDLCSWPIPAAWTAGAKTAPSIWTPIWN